MTAVTVMLWMIVMLNYYTHVSSQSLKKYEIGDSGCAGYLYCDPGVFDRSYSQDSAAVYTTECVHEEAHYGVICIALRETIVDLEIAEELLTSYLDYLKTTFLISSSAGYGAGHRLQERADTRGIIDYWIDEENNNWKIKAWTDGNFIAVLFAYAQEDIPETRVNIFLDGFRLPGM